MTLHPGYPANYHSLIECRKLGLCFHCQTNPAAGELEGYPICKACRKRYKVKVTPGGRG